MDERTLQWRVGIVVICAALILAILIFLFGEGWQSQYTLFIETRTAPNVTKNTPVRKNGILIGRVSAVENLDRGVLLTLRINADEQIFENEECKIATASLLGDAVIDFVPGGAPSRGNPITDRMVFENVTVSPNPIEVALDLEQKVSDTLDSVRRAGDSVDEAGRGVDALSRTIQEAIGAETGELKQFIADARNIAAKAETALDNFSELMSNFNDVVGDPETRDNIRVSINKLPQMLDEVNATILETRETINSFRSISESAETNLDNLLDFTEALGAKGPEFVDSLERSLRNVDELVTQVTAFTQSITQGQGTLGKLINDPELYNYLNETLRNARDISVKLQPLINDLRYAADGIARDPGQLGLRGAFDRRPAGSGYKGTITGN